MRRGLAPQRIRGAGRARTRTASAPLGQSPILLSERDYPKGAKKYDDYRKMLDEMDKNIDGVVISTPDHLHAPIALAAMKRRKHVYVEKNMCRTIEEARRMMAFEKKYKVTVQTGNQGHSTEDMRLVVEWFRAGAIGDVKTVHLYRHETATSPAAATPGGLQVIYENIPKILAQQIPTPDGLLWDLFLGPAPVRGYNPVYHPARWREWLDFGTGGLGDLLNHMIDAPCWALNLGYPTQVEAHPEEGYDWKTNKEVYPWTAVNRWVFPARGKMPAVEVYYHYGMYKETIPKPPGWKEGVDELGKIGGIMFGSKGAMTFGALFASDPREASTATHERELGNKGEGPAVAGGTGQGVQAAGSDPAAAVEPLGGLGGVGEGWQAGRFGHCLWRRDVGDRPDGQRGQRGARQSSRLRRQSRPVQEQRRSQQDGAEENVSSGLGVANLGATAQGQGGTTHERYANFTTQGTGSRRGSRRVHDSSLSGAWPQGCRPAQRKLNLAFMGVGMAAGPRSTH